MGAEASEPGCHWEKTTCFSSLMGLEGYYFSICKSVCSKPGKTQHYFLRTMIVDHTQHVSHNHNHNFFKKILKFQGARTV
jgi:hypothetical protein